MELMVEWRLTQSSYSGESDSSPTGCGTFLSVTVSAQALSVTIMLFEESDFGKNGCS